jgi:hypothetical protein
VRDAARGRAGHEERGDRGEQRDAEARAGGEDADAARRLFERVDVRVQHVQPVDPGVGQLFVELGAPPIGRGRGQEAAGARLERGVGEAAVARRRRPEPRRRPRPVPIERIAERHARRRHRLAHRPLVGLAVAAQRPVPQRELDAPGRAVHLFFGVDRQQVLVADLGNELEHTQKALVGDQGREQEQRDEHAVRNPESGRETQRRADHVAAL